MIKNFKWLVLVSLTFVACTNNDDTTVVEEPVVAGSANFTKYVALGDSFAAGYSDGALFKTGQEGSYPNILAQQFAAAGGGTFTTPFMSNFSTTIKAVISFVVDAMGTFWSEFFSKRTSPEDFKTTSPPLEKIATE